MNITSNCYEQKFLIIGLAATTLYIISMIFEGEGGTVRGQWFSISLIYNLMCYHITLILLNNYLVSRAAIGD